MSDQANNTYSLENRNLKRKLGLGAAVAISVGTTIGSGIFSSVGEVAGASGCALFVILAFLIGTIMNLPINLCYAELATAFPEDGSQYIYFRETVPGRWPFSAAGSPSGAAILRPSRSWRSPSLTIWPTSPASLPLR